VPFFHAQSAGEIPLPEIGGEDIVDIDIDAAQQRARIPRAVDHRLVEHRRGLTIAM
jgi:hypothetical protein